MPEQQRPDTSGFEAGPDQNSSPAAALAAAAKAKRPPAKPLSEVAEVVPAGGGSTSGLHTTTVLSQDRIERYRRSRFNALLGITPTRLVQYLSDWEAGYLRNMALTMEQILRRDAVYKTVAPKRYADAARQTWQVQVLPGHEKDPEALAQKAALEHFYHNLRCKSAVDGNQTGGVALAIRQMIKFGVGLKYCVHEILWRQTPDGVTATLNHVPPWFFEARTGKLRFLMEDFAWDGVPMAVHDPTANGGAMEVGSWMVSVGEGLMESGSILYIYGNYALRDWGDYSEQRGYPLMKAHTSAPEGSPRWEALIGALASFSPRNPLVMGPKETEDLDILSTAAQGQFAPALLWEEMKKCKTALWRGGDLGTVSAGAGSGQGASLQGGETTNLQEDDCQWVSENFQTQLDPLVVRVVRGPNVPVLVYFSLGGSKKSNTALELQVDTFLLGAGFPLSVGSVAERFNRPVPQPDEPLLKKPEPPSPFGGGGRFGGKGAPPFGGEGGADEEGNPQGAEEAEADATPDTDKEQGPEAGDEEEDALGRLRRPAFGNELANARPEVRPLVAQALARVGAAQSAALKPVAERLRKLLAAPDGELEAGLLRLRRDLPSMLRELNKQPKAAAAFESAIGTALAAGAAGAEKANEGFANKGGFVTMDDHVVFVGKEKDETDGGDRNAELGGAPKRVSEKDQEEIRLLAEKSGKAESEKMDYFLGEKDKYEASGKEWGEHPLFKGKDPTHAGLTKASKQAREKLDARVSELGKRYPYLKDGLYFGFTPSGQEAVEKMARFHRDAVIDHVREGISKEVEPVVKRIREADKTTDPTSLKTGQHVWDSKTQKVFQVSRLTHGGKRAMATDETGIESRLSTGRSAPLGGIAGSGHYYHKITNADAKEYRKLMGEFKKRVEAEGVSFQAIKNTANARPLVRRLDAPDPGGAALALANEHGTVPQELGGGRYLVAAPGSLWLVSRTALTHGGERANAEAFDALRKQAESEAPAPSDEAEADPDAQAREAMAEALGTAPDDPLVDAALGAGLDPADPELTRKAQQALAVAQGKEGSEDAPGAPEAASGQGSAEDTPPGTPGAPEQPTAADAAPDKPFPKPPAGPPPELMDFQQFQRSGWAKPSALGLVASNAGQLGAQHKAHYTQAVEARKPVLKRVADYYGVQVPYGYQEQGDRYVWKGDGPPKRPVGTEAAANEEFDEAKHPRGKDGRWVDSQGRWELTESDHPMGGKRWQLHDKKKLFTEWADFGDASATEKVRGQAVAEFDKRVGASAKQADKAKSYEAEQKLAAELPKDAVLQQGAGYPPLYRRGGKWYTEQTGGLLDRKLFPKLDKALHESIVAGKGKQSANEKDPGFSGQSDKLGAAQSGRVGSVTEPFEHAYAPNPSPSPLSLTKQPTSAPPAKAKGPKPPELMDPDEFAASEHATAKALGVGANQPWHLRAAHRSYVEDAMGKLKPLSRAAVESFNAVGFKLAGGYKDAGDGTLAWSQGEEEVPPKTWAQ